MIGPPGAGKTMLARRLPSILPALSEEEALEALRQPMEDGRVVIARAARSVAYPARFTLVGAMNPCPCGFAGDPTRVCSCGEDEALKYRARLSGPLLDRIDLHLVLAAVPLRQLSGVRGAESSHMVRDRVERARAVQRGRATMRGDTTNARAKGRTLLRELPTEARTLLNGAADAMSLSARGYHRVVKVARTIADLAGSDVIAPAHVAEALRYRPRNIRDVNAAGGAGAIRIRR